MTFQFCTQRPLSCDTDSVSICGQDANGDTQSVRTDSYGSVSTLPNSSAYSQIGRLFSVGFTPNVNQVKTIFFINPAANNRIMFLDQIYCGVIVSPQAEPVSYAGNVVIEIKRDATFSSAGVPLTPNNLNLGFPDNSTIQVTVNPTFILGGTGLFITNLLNEMATIDLQGRIIVPPNHNLLIQFSTFPTTGKSVDIIANITYYELDI